MEINCDGAMKRIKKIENKSGTNAERKHVSKVKSRIHLDESHPFQAQSYTFYEHV